MKALGTLAAQIAALSTEDRNKLLSLSRVRAALAPNKRAKPRIEEALYNCLAQELRSQLQAPTMRYPTFKTKSTYAKDFLTAVSKVDEYLDTATATALTDTQRTSAYGLIAELAVRSARSWKNEAVPMWRRVLSTLDNIAGLVEAAFPGYAESGLLNTVLVARRSGAQTNPKQERKL